jgi:sigma-B regulation protein RsbU (phosphoserine phosphatase)
LAGFKHLTLLSDGIFELMKEPSLAEKEHRLLELVMQPNHTMHDFLDELRKEGLTKGAPDDITVLTVELY